MVHAGQPMGNTTSFADTSEGEIVEVAPEPVEAAVEEVQEVEEAEAEEPEAPPVKLWTAPIDRRFPSTNQARNCYTRYNEFYKCIKENDADPESYDGPCGYYKKCYESLCPIEWIERWEEQREEGTWPGKY